MDQSQTLIPFHIARAFEELIEDRINDLLRGRDKTFHCHLVGKLPGDQALVICEVDRNFDKQRCTCG